MDLMQLLYINSLMYSISSLPQPPEVTHIKDISTYVYKARRYFKQ